MKKTFAFVVFMAATGVFSACGGGAANEAANAVIANKVEKAVAAAPTKELLVGLETQAIEAWKKGDSAFWETFLDASYVGFANGKRHDKAGEIKMLTDSKCEIGRHTFSDEKMVPVGNDAVVLTLKTAVEGKCGGQKLPSPLITSTLFIRSGETWKAAYHNQVPIGDDKPTKPAAPKKAEPKSPPPAEPAAREGKTAPTMTDILMAVEKKTWDAWKTREAAQMSPLLTEDITVVDFMGNVKVGKQAVLDGWFKSKCEITSAVPVDGMGTQTAPFVAILTYKGTATGNCEGFPLSDFWATAIFQKQAEEWKIAYVFETPIG